VPPHPEVPGKAGPRRMLTPYTVMPGLVPGIHERAAGSTVDGRHKAGHDVNRFETPYTDSRNRFVIGYLRSRPKLRVVTFTPGAAWRRLYSARFSMRSTRATSAAS
jgi:hypothetical protein